MRHHKLFLRFHRRPLDNFDVSIGSSLQRGRIQTQELPPPPHPGGAFFRHCREPVLPEDRADLMRRLPCEKGLLAKSASTSLSFDSRSTSVLGTIGYSRHDPREANHKFQSKRG